MYIYILIVSLCIFYVLTEMDDNRNVKLHKPPTSKWVRISMFFFVFVITSVGFHFFWNQADSSMEGGQFINVDNNHLKHIYQEVEVGLPEF